MGLYNSHGTAHNASNQHDREARSIFGDERGVEKSASSDFRGGEGEDETF